jgi:hypothetical protein
MVAQLSTLPHIRDIACTEMVARAAKYVFYARLRNAVLHFKSVGATQIDGEMRSYASLSMSTLLGKGDRNFRYFEEKIRGVILRKYSYDMTYDSFMALHRPALFGALQYQVFKFSIFNEHCSNFVIVWYAV